MSDTARIAGIDEAGRGPWAGPVVAAAVVLRPRDRQGGAGPWTLSGARVDDSKRLTSLQRDRAFREILLRADVGVGIVPAEAIDRSDILQATFQAMRQAVEALDEPPALALIDGSQLPPLACPCRAIVGGDGLNVSIACASIVAKVLRDSLMTYYHRLFPEWGFDRHKGYGTALHRAALSQRGVSPLHRASFQPVAEALRAQETGLMAAA